MRWRTQVGECDTGDTDFLDQTARCINILGSARVLACLFRRPRRNGVFSENMQNKVRGREGAITGTRGACAPQIQSSRGAPFAYDEPH